MLIMTLLTGMWTTACIQTQISNVNSGYAKETYSIVKDGSYEWKREWYTDSKCTFLKDTDSESGTITVGEKVQTIFLTGDAYEADFSSQAGVDLGLVSVKNNKLKIARGVRNSNMRNTMLSLFEFIKH